MNAYRTVARIAGALFLIAMAASLIGAALVGSVISTPDWPSAVAEGKTTLIVGVLLELVNAIAVLGIGVLMLPVLRPHSAPMAHGYLGFRTVEAVFCAAIVIAPLALLELSERAVAAAPLSAESFAAAAGLALAGREGIVNLLIPVFFCLGALLLYTVLYRAILLPRFISVWGLIAVIMVLGMNLVGQFAEIPMGIMMILALPIILNEIFMGIWLIVRGFNVK